MQGNQPHPATPLTDAVFLVKRGGKKRGNYSCGRCGLPKKGHKCPYTAKNGNPDRDNDDVSAATPTAGNSSGAVVLSPNSVVRPMPPARRRALSFDESVEEFETEGFDLDDGSDLERSGKLPMSCLWEVFKRLPPTALSSSAAVCRGWRETAKRMWRAAEELRLRVPAKAQIGLIGSLLQKCPALLRLSLRFESDVDATILACIAFSCPNLHSLEIFTSDSSVNWITGDELSRFISDKRCLSNLKMEGCCYLGGLVFSSTSLSTLWLSDLHSLTRMVFNCPNLREISLNFSRQENDNTDLVTAMDSLGRSCLKLQNIHISSMKLSHDAVLALSAANLRGLRMLSLVLGTEITDASVAAIASSFLKLDLLDLSGSSISDSGIGMICNVFPDTLSKLLLALCPNITSSGIQFAAAQLPRLELMDCGMTIPDPGCENNNNSEPYGAMPHHILQKLIIKHDRLKRLSLWGCSGLDALYLNCPRLTDLNLNSCTNLNPGRVLLQCPNLESVHTLDCDTKLIEAIQTQVDNSFPMTSDVKRFPDGSKRVRVPYICSPENVLSSEDERKCGRPLKRGCTTPFPSR